MNSKFYNIIFALVLNALMVACTKDKNPSVGQTNKVKFNTSSVTSIGADSAISGGIISSDGGDPIEERGVCWATSTNPIVNLNSTKNGSGTGTFISILKPLLPNTTYYVRSYIINAQGIIYGNQLSFKTNIRVPIIQTTAATSITQTGAITGGSNISDGGSSITQKGICWSSTNPNPTIINNFTSAGSGTLNFSIPLQGLSPNTTYYARAFATSAAGTGYGNIVQFKTLPALIPNITTSSITNIGLNSANAGGNISSDGGASVTQRGICWSTSSNPTTANFRTIDGSGTGAFSSQMTGLQTNQIYYVRAYAINSSGTAYGQQLTFITLSAQLPSVATTSISSISQTTANSGGNVSNEGGASVIQRGICWSTSSNPTIANSRSIDGSGVGFFSSQMTGLQSNRTYYVRAYATNTVGTSYGSQVSFTTLSYQLPSISTASITGISRTSAQGGGNVTNDGGYSVTQRGVCWSTSQNPTTANSRTINGTGAGVFTSSISGLSPATTYYVRAYATNALGTAYGAQTSFRTNN